MRAASLAVEARSVTALVGSNGAGKTTLLRTVAGLLQAEAGAIRLDGADMVGSRCHERVESGVVLVPEGRLIFPLFTVEENLRIGAFAPRARAAAARQAEEMYALFPRLNERRRQLAGTLSGGEQQMLAIARGLMARPRLLLLDEPTLGLAPLATTAIFELVDRLRASGLTVILAEQDVRRTLGVSMCSKTAIACSPARRGRCWPTPRSKRAIWAVSASDRPAQTVPKMGQRPSA